MNKPDWSYGYYNILDEKNPMYRNYENKLPFLVSYFEIIFFLIFHVQNHKNSLKTCKR